MGQHSKNRTIRLAKRDILPLKAYMIAKQFAQVGQVEPVLEMYDILNQYTHLTVQQKHLFVRLVLLAHICCEDEVTQSEAWKILIMCVGTNRHVTTQLYDKLNLPTFVKNTITNRNWMQRLYLEDTDRLPINDRVVNALTLLSFETTQKVLSLQHILEWCESHGMRIPNESIVKVIKESEKQVARAKIKVALAAFLLLVIVALTVSSQLRAQMKETYHHVEIRKAAKNIHLDDERI